MGKSDEQGIAPPERPKSGYCPTCGQYPHAPASPEQQRKEGDGLRELDEAIAHIKAMRLTALALIAQVCGSAGTTEGNKIATDLNSVVKIAQDWLITRASMQPKPQPKIPRTTHG